MLKYTITGKKSSFKFRRPKFGSFSNTVYSSVRPFMASYYHYSTDELFVILTRTLATLAQLHEIR